MQIKQYNETLGVIIPVHALNSEAEETLLASAIKSVLNQKETLAGQLILVAPEGEVRTKAMTIFGKVSEEHGNGFEQPTPTGVANSGNTCFQAQVNLAVAALKPEITHFVVLELDDLLRPMFVKHATQSIQANPDAAVLLPLVEEVNAEGQLLKYSNEVLWTPSFSENLGILDYEALQGYANFHLTGAVIKKSAFVELGGLKESMELTFNYEFLLRVAQRNLEIVSIPRVIYTHLDAREGSLFKSYTEGRTALTSEEVRFWFDTAHKECVFTEDRKVSYSPTQGE